MADMKIKLAIVGTRNPKLSYKECTGIDTYAKLFAGRHHIPLMEFLPDYSKYGKSAPLRRNSQIVKEATNVIAFPSAESRGTFHSISEARKMHKQLVIKQI